MAFQSQGAEIRRKSTVAGTTGSTSGAEFVIDSTLKQIKGSNAACDFAAAGFSSGMRLTITGTTNNNTGIYTISSVAATHIGIYDNVTAQAVGDILTVEAHRYDAIGQVKGFAGPTGAAAVIDVTHLQSTAKEKLIGLRDEGNVTLDLFYDPINATAQQIALRDDRANRTLQIFDIKFADQDAAATSYPSGMNFGAYVSNFSISAAVDNAITGSVTLEITSAVKYILKV